MLPSVTSDGYAQPACVSAFFGKVTSRHINRYRIVNCPINYLPSRVADINMRWSSISLLLYLGASLVTGASVPNVRDVAIRNLETDTELLNARSEVDLEKRKGGGGGGGGKGGSGGSSSSSNGGSGSGSSSSGSKSGSGSSSSSKYSSYSFRYTSRSSTSVKQY